MFTNWSGGQGTPIWLEQDRWHRMGAQAAFSFRLGGVSKPPFDSLNVGSHVGDDVTAVAHNRRIVARKFAVPVEDIAWADQVHGNRVARVDESWRRLPADKRRPFAASDALVTDMEGVAVAVVAADCVPVLFFDPVRRVVGAAHSGWRGTVLGIVQNVLEVMVMDYGSNIRDIRAVLGPSIRSCCYEVSEAVASQLADRFGPRHVFPRPCRPGKFLVSLASCIRQDFVRAGMCPEYIEDVGVCTSCHNDVLFSHRADGGHTGRLLGIVRLSAQNEGAYAIGRV
ncbi:MAG: peptidoglycan editing factor PgeF [Alicyclobacillus herbarius]|uniref:peptidoglycan editing factor PgeF n=1 Tax=Alicyclobacillus herbarius TaxID=122960 RepID=UPI0023520A33|nr:peptidoglycan editing factor PgeF [Alicyclobacillus herbarius]MCL6631677.1 peptidoglycan editing factor PgeF [Alicyclobacillus herbarius]